MVGGGGKWHMETYEDSFGCVTEGVEVDELFDFSRQAQEGRIHDVGQVPSQSLHVVAGLFHGSECHPVCFVVSIRLYIIIT